MKQILLLLLFTSTIGFGQFSFQREFDIQVTKDALIQKFPWVGGLNNCQFSNFDLNYDGVKDLFIFDRTGDKVLTFIQNGAPGVMDFEYAPEYEDAFPQLSDWAIAVDYNCDGREDIFSWTFGGCQVHTNTGDSGSGLSFSLDYPILYYDSALEPLTFLFMNSVDVNAFVDVDGDGDIDILMWEPDGSQEFVEYYKNLSVEQTTSCDTLIFEQKNRCWGKFKETGADLDYSLFETFPPCDGELPGEENWVPYTGRTARHGGGTLCALDLDASGVLDIIVGDGLNPNLAWLTNDGTGVNMDSNMDFQEKYVPKPDSVHLNQLVAAFYVDLDNDGVRDLVATPQTEGVVSQDWESVWYYPNSGADNLPTFTLGGKDLLQGDMIDNGTRAHPVYFDANGDGLLDILVSSRERHDSATMDTKGFIYYYENTGTLSDPEFTLITEDYEDISLMDIGAEKNFYPTFADLDGDGDEDMILGEYVGWHYYFENTGGASNPAIFNTSVLLQDNVSDFINRSNGIPKLVDLDHDLDYDLVIAGVDGRLTYYENVGTASAYSFQFVTDYLGQLDVGPTDFATSWAVPEFIDIDGEWEVLIGTLNGYLHYYDNIEGNIGGAWNEVSNSVENINIGRYASPALKDLDGDGRFEMLLGCDRGGIGFFSTAPISEIGNPELAIETTIQLYPNPATGLFTIDLGERSYKSLINTQISIYDISGRLISQIAVKQSKTEVDASRMAKGTYLIEVVSKSESTTLKLVLD